MLRGRKRAIDAQPPGAGGNESKMNIYAFRKEISDYKRVNLVLALRRSGFAAWMEAETLHTDASLTVIGLVNGSALVVKPWAPPIGWFKAAHVARDAEAMYQALVDDNENRMERELPTFEPSYELAQKIVER